MLRGLIPKRRACLREKGPSMVFMLIDISGRNHL